MNNDAHYDEVAKEIQAQTMVPGLWTKAFSETGGQVDKARALYIKFRVSQLAEAASDKLRKERRVKMEVAKKRAVSSFRRFICILFSIIFGLLTLICGICALIGLFNKPIDTNMISSGSISALVFGLLTYISIEQAKI